MNLSHAGLSGAGLGFADLRCANILRTDLNGAGLTEATLNFARLLSADLRNANMNGANLTSAFLQKRSCATWIREART
ncbi:pentapeptide repeat-containing protein [Streptomyces sp. NPDC059698]|uniref:pentapeptide repeat-containing protein n=1 Tax=unclassified Streptomyces TaxID=2593676 RepID=UPI00093BC01A|nr:pentapeptide repeat-containing protein [Streptomyces sp. CB02366]